jgi:predicted metal-dependent peptidase
METDPAKKKLRRGRTMLILGDGDEPFFGSVAIGLELVEHKGCSTAATDGKQLIYNPDWILTLDAEETMALFEHEVYHVALKHGTLMREVMDEPDFDWKLWQESCDHPINSRLLAKGRKLPLPPGGGQYIYDPKYDGMSAIRIYRILLKEKKDAQKAGSTQSPQGDPQKSDGNGDMGTDPVAGADKQKELFEETGGFGGILPLTDKDGNPASQEQLEQATKDFEMTIMNSARVLEKTLESSVGDMPGFVKEIIEAHTEPQRSYKDEILDIMEEITRDDYSWSRPNRKYDVYLPTLYDKELAELVVLVDSSGSVSQNELEIYAGEISGILEEFEHIKIHVIFHHTQAYNLETFEHEDLPVKFGNIVSGGTNYRDAYDRIDREGFEPKAIWHFTDLDVYSGAYPDKEPDFPVFWMNTSPRKADGSLRYSTPPWGRVIDLDPDA